MSRQNLKPFDVQLALSGEPVLLRNGSKAFVVADLRNLFPALNPIKPMVVTSTLVSFEVTIEGAFVDTNEDRIKPIESPLDIVGMWDTVCTNENIMKQIQVNVVHQVKESDKADIRLSYVDVQMGVDDLHVEASEQVEVGNQWLCDFDAMTKIREIETQLAEARKDSERLDFIITESRYGNHLTVRHQNVWDGEEYKGEMFVVYEFDINPENHSAPLGDGKTSREAIDAAMAAAGKDGG